MTTGEHVAEAASDHQLKRVLLKLSGEVFGGGKIGIDPDVVNGIAQPSSLVMGYVYRPYTANSVVFGLRYHWD